jgi:putative membrane protein
MVDERVTSASSPAAISFELASRNTGLSIQRTRLSADRTLMSVIRTSLSLISFGFTIFQVFRNLTTEGVLKNDVDSGRHFGVTLVLLGNIMLVIGIIYHVQFMLGLRATRRLLKADGLIHGKSLFPLSFTLVTAVILFALGIAVTASMLFHVGPFE